VLAVGYHPGTRQICSNRYHTDILTQVPHKQAVTQVLHRYDHTDILTQVPHEDAHYTDMLTQVFTDILAQVPQRHAHTGITQTCSRIYYTGILTQLQTHRQAQLGTTQTYA
jgi:hypothetical protein